MLMTELATVRTAASIAARKRADAIHARRVARGASVGQPDAEHPKASNVSELPESNAAFDYDADIAAYPFRWMPGEEWDSYKEQVSQNDLGTCKTPGCDNPVRTLTRRTPARAACCEQCMTPDDMPALDLEWVSVVRRRLSVPWDWRKPAYVLVNTATGEVWAGRPTGADVPDREHAMRVLALCLPAARPVETQDAKTVNRQPRQLYTVNDTREVVWLYGNHNLSIAEIARRTGVPYHTAQSWVKRHASASDPDSLYLQRPPTDGRLIKEQVPNVDLEKELQPA